MTSKQRKPYLFYIEDSEEFSRGKYKAGMKYNLKNAKSLTPDIVKGKKLDLTADSIYLSRYVWSRYNDGLLSYAIVLGKPVVIPGEKGIIDEQKISRLEFAHVFKNAAKRSAVANLVDRPIFRGLDVDRYLTDEYGIPRFKFEVRLAKSSGKNSNAVIDLVDSILDDPVISKGLGIIPYFGAASAVFSIIKKKFFGTSDQEEIWPTFSTEFTGSEGSGFALKVGRYAILSSNLSPDKVENFYRYEGEHLVDIRSGREVTEADQFFLDVYVR